MTRIAVSRTMEIGLEAVWEAMADLGSHVEWMRDAHSIRFTTDQRRGVGTRMEVKTVVGPFRTIDVMEVVGWEEGKSIEVTHEGLVEGRGTLAATPRGEATVITWEEELTFPWWLGGMLTAWLARPVLAAIWRGNLRRLEKTLTPL